MKTNSTQSNLSKYGYDMVVAVTQQSVNEVMAQFMSQHEQKQYLLVLKGEMDEETEVTTYVPVDPAVIGMDKLELLLETPGAKSERTQEQIDNYTYLFSEHQISYVCRVQLGINKEVIDKAPNIIQLQSSDIDSKFNAIFNLIFKEFSLIHVYSNGFKVLFEREEQPKDQIWRFAYYIKLNYIKDIPDNRLPEQIKNELRKYVPSQFSNLFDIRALYADFSTAAISGFAPQIEHDPTMKDVVSTFFEDFVLKDLRESDIQAIFSYSIKPETDILAKLDKALVIPAAYKYFVSPYYDESGKEQKQLLDLYTINYIIMEKDKQFPELRPLTWNWVDEGERKAKQGCMAINSSHVIDRLQKDMKEITKGAYLKPTVTLSDKFIKINVNTSYAEEDCPGDLYFVKNDDGSEYTLTFNAHSKDGVYSSSSFGIYVGVGITYNLKMTIKPDRKERNKITIKIENDAQIEMQTGASKSKGRMFKDTFTCVLLLHTDAAGNISLSKEIKHDHLDDDISHNFFVDLFCLGTDRACLDGINSYTQNIADTINDGLKDKLWNVFDNNTHWVLPGGNTFIFKNPAISDNNDLIADLTYAEIE